MSYGLMDSSGREYRRRHPASVLLFYFSLPGGRTFCPSWLLAFLAARALIPYSTALPGHSQGTPIPQEEGLRTNSEPLFFVCAAQEGGRGRTPAGGIFVARTGLFPDCKLFLKNGPLRAPHSSPEAQRTVQTGPHPHSTTMYLAD